MDEDAFLSKLRKQHRKDCRAPEWKAYVFEMCAKRGHRCERCGRRGGRLTVHHKCYEDGLRLWEYPDHAVQVVHVGDCHREADDEREEQNRRDKISKEFGPEALKELPPPESELRKLAQNETPFKQWLIDCGRLPSDYDWNEGMYPLWWFWNQFSEKFHRETKPHNEVQLGLDL
jgi:hypothetical protein